MRLKRSSYVVLLLGIAVGILCGVGGYTFLYAKGLSYMKNDPEVCANCHIMQEYYDRWTHGSHHAVAVCNDCHTPPDFVGKYLTKGRNGMRHSYAFTTGDFHEPLQIKPDNRKIAEVSCRKCHADLVQAMDGGGGGQDKPVSCIRCHGAVGHP